MGYTKPAETTKEKLISAPLPNHGDTYTVIRHKYVIDAAKNLLKTHGFNIKTELYRANMNAKVAQGVYHIESNKDEELGMMFAWTNSYDKSTRFQCGIGAYVFVCNNGMICGDLANYARKHTGNADTEVFNHMMSQVKHADKYFDELINDKDEFKKTELSLKEQSELLGRLFIEEELIDSGQLSCIKSEIKDPSYSYNCDINNAWTFYNHVTHAFKKSHPRTWMSDQQKFHQFMIAELLSQSQLHSFDQTPSNRIDLGLKDRIVTIDELEAAKPMYEKDFEADLEAQDYDTFGEMKI